MNFVFSLGQERPTITKIWKIRLPWYIILLSNFLPELK